MGRAQLGGAAGRKGHKIMMEQKATADLTWVLSKADLPWFYIRQPWPLCQTRCRDSSSPDTQLPYMALRIPLPFVDYMNFCDLRGCLKKNTRLWVTASLRQMGSWCPAGRTGRAGGTGRRGAERSMAHRRWTRRQGNAPAQ